MGNVGRNMDMIAELKNFPFQQCHWLFASSRLFCAGMIPVGVHPSVSHKKHTHTKVEHVFVVADMHVGFVHTHTVM